MPREPDGIGAKSYRLSGQRQTLRNRRLAHVYRGYLRHHRSARQCAPYVRILMLRYASAEETDESRAQDTHDRGPGPPARHPARLTYLTIAGESSACTGSCWDGRCSGGAKPRLSDRDLRRRPRDSVPEGRQWRLGGSDA
jgi:hypothetical protein